MYSHMLGYKEFFFIENNKDQFSIFLKYFFVERILINKFGSSLLRNISESVQPVVRFAVVTSLGQ